MIKKNNIGFLMIAAMVVAVILTGCSSNGMVEEAAQEEMPIAFSSTTQNVTRAEITDPASLATAGGIKVWGFKSANFNAASPTITSVFDGTKVSSTDGDTWTYSPIKYWDKMTGYKFFAAGPADDNISFSLNETNDGAFTIADVASGLAADSKDYVIDRQVNTTEAGKFDKVGFDFHHIMAKVDFKLAKASILDGRKVIVTNIKMSGWDNATGKFVQTKFDGTWAELNCSEWTRGTAVAGNVDVLSSEDGTELSTTASATNTNTYIMVPQSIDANTLTFTIDYTIDGQPFEEQDAAIADAQTWGTDSHTTYTITISPNQINFDVEQTCEFCNKPEPADIFEEGTVFEMDFNQSSSSRYSILKFKRTNNTFQLIYLEEDGVSITDQDQLAFFYCTDEKDFGTKMFYIKSTGSDDKSLVFKLLNNPTTEKGNSQTVTTITYSAENNIATYSMALTKYSSATEKIDGYDILSDFKINGVSIPIVKINL